MAATHPSLSTHHTQIASATAHLQGLQRKSHEPRDLCTRALTFFDRPTTSYTNEQKKAADRLRAWFDVTLSEIKATKALTEAKVEELIVLIGEVFFLSGLDDVPFYYYRKECNPPYKPGKALAFTSVQSDGREFIALNLLHPHFNHKSAKICLWRKAEQIFHEATHAYFVRHARIDPLDNRGGHQAAWQLTIKALESRLKTEFGWKLKLNRRIPLIGDLIKGHTIDLTANELHNCFGDRLEFDIRGTETRMIDKISRWQVLKNMMKIRALSVPRSRLYRPGDTTARPL